MRVTRLYINQPLETGAEISLQGEQVHYLANVLRLRVGDSIRVFNGKAEEYDASLVKLQKKEAIIAVTNCYQCERESPLKICLGIGLSRGQHMDYSIQKAVELGVHTIVPVLSEFSNVKLQQDRLQNKMMHWQHIIINATEQCGRTMPAELLLPQYFADFVNAQTAELKLVFHPEGKTTFAGIESKPDNICMLTGPEGGFSDNEIQLAETQGFTLVRFGPRILRAETAVVAALTACQSAWGDLC